MKNRRLARENLHFAKNLYNADCTERRRRPFFENLPKLERAVS
jgi:hypothetical protein